MYGAHVRSIQVGDGEQPAKRERPGKSLPATKTSADAHEARMDGAFRRDRNARAPRALWPACPLAFDERIGAPVLLL